MRSRTNGSNTEVRTGNDDNEIGGGVMRLRIRRGSLLTCVFTASICVLCATPNEALRREFDRAISKWVARDSRGLYYLLIPRRNPEGKSRFGLAISRGPSPKSLSDFVPPAGIVLPDRPEESILSARMAVGAQDRLDPTSSWQVTEPAPERRVVYAGS